MRLLLVRHGQTPANVRGALATDRPGPRLTRLGIRQAKAIPKALADERIDAIYVSPLIRTSLTAAPLASALSLEPTMLEGLEEIEAGSLEGKTDRESVKAYMGTVFAWGNDELDRAMPGGPDGRAFFTRFDAAISRIAAENTENATVVVVSHGAAIRVWTAYRARNLAADFVRTHQLDNTGVVAMSGSPGRTGDASDWVIESWAGEPIGGELLTDPDAPDPTGESAG